MCKIGMSEQREYAIAAYLLPHFPHILANSYTWQAGSSRIQEAKSIIENATCYYAPRPQHAYCKLAMLHSAHPSHAPSSISVHFNTMITTEQ